MLFDYSYIDYKLQTYTDIGYPYTASSYKASIKLFQVSSDCLIESKTEKDLTEKRNTDVYIKSFIQAELGILGVILVIYTRVVWQWRS